MTWPLAVLVAGVAGTLVPLRRVPPYAVAAAVAAVALLAGVVPAAALGDALDALAAPLAFLLVAVPLAVLLDGVGFFAAMAALVGGGRHLRLGLWALAAAVTVLFNLDAAVVLLTPLYVRIAVRRGEDPLALAFVPALMASLASTVLPVSNLTNLVVVEQIDLGAGDFLRHAAPSSLAAVAVGWFAYRRAFAPSRGPAVAGREEVDRRALRIGIPVVVWLLAGFTVGERAGVPAWVVAAGALVALVALTRRLPWRAAPVGPAVLALALGTLAIAAAPSLHLDALFELDGRVGDTAVFGAAAAGANVTNNLPATVVSLPSLEAHPARVWALLLGVNLGPLLWVTGALSTLLWQATMARLGHPVSARRYAAVGWRVGVPALVMALAVRLALG
ncbi:MAG TPA: SLC13 family permease [Ilumatobacteraceae bacterium]|nr:SLC13 family permease [Ilumatobacteraceae bacterium]